MKTTFKEALRVCREAGHELVCEGAMGTSLQAMGMQSGERTERFGFDHPDIVSAVHRGYLAAGANVVKPNTFGISPMALKLATSGKSADEKGFTVKQAVQSALDSAKKAIAEVQNRDI
jgi:5-methyltetrahydrofolate--homocysteine methyltransferase